MVRQPKKSLAPAAAAGYHSAETYPELPSYRSLAETTCSCLVSAVQPSQGMRLSWYWTWLSGIVPVRTAAAGAGAVWLRKPAVATQVSA